MSKITVTTIAGATSGADANKVKIESGDELNVVNGDLTVNTNKLFVDASTDLIGIGTTSPATATGGGIDIHRNGGSSVRIDDTTNSVTGELQVYSAGLNLATVTNHNLVLSTNNSAKMTINASGQVTIPNQPAFKQGVDNRNATGSDRVISGNNGDTFTYAARDNHNVGSHWSSTTGRFTCPVAGTYMFYCSIMRHGTNGTILENRIKKNGNLMYARAYAGAYTAAYQQSMLVTTSVCAVNDYIEFFVQGTVSMYQDDTYLGGYLLG